MPIKNQAQFDNNGQLNHHAVEQSQIIEENMTGEKSGDQDGTNNQSMLEEEARQIADIVMPR